MKPVSEYPPTFLDLLNRPLRSLRLSVTDRCNLRCQYCMPEEEYVWLPRKEILTLEEASGLVDIFAELGVDKVRLTGGRAARPKRPCDPGEDDCAQPADRRPCHYDKWGSHGDRKSTRLNSSHHSIS